MTIKKIGKGLSKSKFATVDSVGFNVAPSIGKTFNFSFRLDDGSRQLVLLSKDEAEWMIKKWSE